jgi:CDP-diglyceride synthetase
MKSTEMIPSYKNLIKRGFLTFLFIGILFSIIQDKTILSYFLQLQIILQILFFAIIGGLLSSWINYKIIKRNKWRESKNPE